jgi:ribonuclease J
VISLLQDRETGRLLEKPEIITRGFVYKGDVEDILGSARQRIVQTMREGNGNAQKDIEQMVKTIIYNQTKRRPMVFVTVNRA